MARGHKKLLQPAAAQSSVLFFAARQKAVREAGQTGDYHLLDTHCCKTMLVKVKKPNNTQKITDGFIHLHICKQAAVEL